MSGADPIEIVRQRDGAIAVAPSGGERLTAQDDDHGQTQGSTR